ncbi:MAG: dockerin type I repeat-containing protein [Clostridia bacterium]|nr:dockerin type I repeat-containing protein [Clostridia bacterium]
MKNKKIIAIIVAIVLVVSIFAIGTMANTKNTSISISIDKTELSAGQSATVTVKASADYPVATASIPVFYDKTMVTVSNATATLTDYAVSNVTTDLTAVDSSKIYENTAINSEKFGFVLVTYIGGAGDTVSAIDNKTVLTFTITAKSAVSGEALVKCVTESAKTEENVAGMLYFGTTTSGTTITSIPENVENINVTNASTSATITSGSADLVAKSDMPTAIDSTNKYIYGITPGDNIEDYIKVNNGSFELVANSSGYTNGTGATVKVKNASGTVVDTYTIIIFGDVNGDGEIKAADKATLNLCVLAGTSNALSQVQLFAGDVNGDGEIKAADKAAINLCLVSGSNDSLTTNPYAK